MDWMNDTNNLLEGWKIGMKNWELEEVKDKYILTKNIDITGFKFNINYFDGVLDGNGYSINGFTSFSSKWGKLNDNPDSDYDFITTNSGIIKNLNFNNVSVIIEELN